ncbi:MAG: hypothetical protein BHW51_10150 [Ruminococcus sp. CAG:9-related_41_34]|nr:MAG: hypothetical protein BHW51_10150 [Ruminococcus sp. CAG:9-related_41_34]
MSGKKRNVMLFVLLFTLLLGVIVPVQAQSYGGTKIIRVAYREDADFINKSSSGVYKGYGVEYLNKISHMGKSAGRSEIRKGRPDLQCAENRGQGVRKGRPDLQCAENRGQGEEL